MLATCFIKVIYIYVKTHICKYCQDERKNHRGLTQHELKCPSNPSRKYKSYTVGLRAWNAGKTKETDPRIMAWSKKYKESIDNGIIKPHGMSSDTKKKLSILAKKRGLGGYRPHPNKGLRYNGIWFDSKWEVEVAKDMDKCGIKWNRPRTGFTWTDTGRRYHPDFYLPEYDVYLDPKNDFLIKKDAEKIAEASRRNNIRIIVLNKNQLSWKAISSLL